MPKEFQYMLEFDKEPKHFILVCPKCHKVNDSDIMYERSFFIIKCLNCGYEEIKRGERYEL